MKNTAILPRHPHRHPLTFNQKREASSSRHHTHASKAPTHILAQDMVQRIETAQVSDLVRTTPLQEAGFLSKTHGRKIYLKREDLQAVFSFKVRGACNRMSQLTQSERQRGVIASSAGNHAQGVALCARHMKIYATIFMPTTTPEVKVEAVKHHGGSWVEVHLCGESFTETQMAAREWERQHGQTFIHPFNDPVVIAGQGTIGQELHQQAPHNLDAVFVPVGGGGLLAGVAAALKTYRPEVKVIGVQALDADAMARSLEAGHRVSLDKVGLFADGTAVKQVEELTFSLCQHFADDIMRVSTPNLCAAMKDIYKETRTIPEPSGALALAGLKQYVAKYPHRNGALTAIISGANMDFERLAFVSEQASLSV